MLKYFRDLFKERDVIRNSSLVFFASTLSNGLSFLINIVLSKMFGPAAFGSFKTTLYLFSLFSGLLDLGVTIALPKYIAQFRGKESKKIGYMTNWFLKLRIATFLVFIVGALVFRNYVTELFLHDKTLGMHSVAGVTIMIAYFFLFLKTMTMGYENFKLYSLSIITSTILYGATGIATGYYFGAVYSIIAYATSTLIGNMVCLKFLIKQGAFRKYKIKSDMKKIFWGYSIPMHLLAIPNLLGISTVPILSLFFPPEIIGYYSFAFMFYFATSSIPYSLGSVLFPKVSRLSGNNKSKEADQSLKRVLYIYTILAALGIIGIVLFSRTFISIIAPEYLPGLLLFKSILAMGLVFGYITIYTVYFSAKGKIKETAILTLIQNLLLFSISYLLLLKML